MGKEGQCVVRCPLRAPQAEPIPPSPRRILRILCILVHLLTLVNLSEPSSSLRICRIPYRRHIEYSLQPDY